jgi:short-subunit dehydrogenase
MATRAIVASSIKEANMIRYQGQWAVVTGASSGLGRGIAARLADRGMSLLLTGRNHDRLAETAQEIRRAAPRIEIETVAADLSTRPGVSALLDRVGDRPVEVLVNNAGFGSYGPFAGADAKREADEIAVDVDAVVALAHAFLPGMIARERGGILNVASTIAFQPAPYQAVYGASKAFVLSFSLALWAEARVGETSCLPRALASRRARRSRESERGCSVRWRRRRGRRSSSAMKS